MKITESRIKKLIRQILLEKITLPHPDEIQKGAYDQLIQGKSIKDIFPNHDREALKNKVELLYNYIKEKELPMPKIIGDPDEFGYVSQYARAESENIPYMALISVLEKFVNDMDPMKLSDDAVEKIYKSFSNSNFITVEVNYNKALRSVKEEFEKLPKDKQILEIKTSILGHKLYLRNDVKNKKSRLHDSIRAGYKKYKNNPDAEPHGIVTGFLSKQFKKTFRKVKPSKEAFHYAIGGFAMSEFLTNYNSEMDYGIRSLSLLVSDLKQKVKQKATSKRVGSQRKVMTQLKDLATEQIKGDTANWFAVHYSGAFSGVGKEDTYLASQTSFIESFGGPGGISSNEYAAVPYPKSAKKLNDSLAAGKSGSMYGVPKIGMVLNGTVTAIYSDDVHSDTFTGFKAHGSGIGQIGEIDPGEGFVRFPGGEQIGKHNKRKAASKFKEFDKHIVLDLEKAEKEIANADVYPGKRGYYECFIDDWYVDGIVCNWKEFINQFPAPQLSGPDGFDAVFNFLKTVKEKKIKIYDENFDTRMIGGFNGLVDVFTIMLDRKGIMKFQEKPDGSLKHPLEGLKKKLGEK